MDKVTPYSMRFTVGPNSASANGNASKGKLPSFPTTELLKVKDAVDGLRKESELNFKLESENADATNHLYLQVSALQKGFNALADAVIEELEAVREESQKWPSERARWIEAMKLMRDDVQLKLNDMHEKYERSLDALNQAWEENRGLREGQEALLRRVGDLEIRIRGHEGSVDRLRDGVAVLQGGLAEDLRGAVQQLAEKVDSRDLVHRQITSMVSDIDGQLRQEINLNRQGAQEDALALRREHDAVMSDVASLRTWCRQLESHLKEDVGRLEPKVNQMAASLESRVQGLLQTHARTSQSLEGLVRSALSEVEDLRTSIRSLENAVLTVRRSQTETQDALFRSSQTFATALKLDPPVSASLLAAVGSQPPPPGLPRAGNSAPASAMASPALPRR